MNSNNITIFRNGDANFLGKKLVLNRKEIRNFDNFLDKVTHDTNANVAIRSIRTPNHGSKVVSLEKLKNGGLYVAVGIEKFKNLEYAKICARPLHQLKPKKPVKPVIHSKIHASSLHQKLAQTEPLRNRIVYIYRNGDERFPGMKLLLDKRLLQSMENVLQYISNKINLRTGAVRSVYTLEGVRLRDPKEFKTGVRYVAVGYEKPFVKIAYSCLPLSQRSPIFKPHPPQKSKQNGAQVKRRKRLMSGNRGDKEKEQSGSPKKHKGKSENRCRENELSGPQQNFLVELTKQIDDFDLNGNIAEKKPKYTLNTTFNRDDELPHKGNDKPNGNSQSVKSIQKHDTFTKVKGNVVKKKLCAFGSTFEVEDPNIKNIRSATDPAIRSSISKEVAKKTLSMDVNILGNNEDPVAARIPSPAETIYKASGENKETALQVNDDQNTNVELTFEMMEAKEVSDEEIVQDGEDIKKED